MLLFYFQSILGIFISALTGSQDPEEVALMAKQGTEVNSNIFYLATWIIGGSTKIHKEKAIVQSFNGIYFNENFTSYLLKALAINSFYY